MQYWGVIASAFPGIFNTTGLVENADGRCGAWSNFLVDVLGSQNIAAVQANIFPTMPAPVLPLGWRYVTAAQDAPNFNHGIDVYQGHSGQSNSFPEYRFNGHAVVKITGLSGTPSTTVYDPSYGKSYVGLTMPVSEQNWEDDSVNDYWWHCLDANGDNQYQTIPDPKGSRQTVFDK